MNIHTRIHNPQMINYIPECYKENSSQNKVVCSEDNLMECHKSIINTDRNNKNLF